MVYLKKKVVVTFFDLNKNEKHILLGTPAQISHEISYFEIIVYFLKSLVIIFFNLYINEIFIFSFTPAQIFLEFHTWM